INYDSKMYPSPVESSSPPKLVCKNMSPLTDTIYNGRLHPNNNHASITKANAVPKIPNSFEDEIAQKKILEMLERKRRRRESHNAVERRRRDNINDRIQELATLLPDSREAVKLNKGAILRKSVDHIRYLHDELRQNQYRIYDLENTLELCRGRLNNQIIATHDHSTLDLSPIQPHNHHLQ
ncbi:Transcription factor E3, partial [Rhizopus stolonifer]